MTYLNSQDSGSSQVYAINSCKVTNINNSWRVIGRRQKHLTSCSLPCDSTDFSYYNKLLKFLLVQPIIWSQSLTSDVVVWWCWVTHRNEV